MERRLTLPIPPPPITLAAALVLAGFAGTGLIGIFLNPLHPLGWSFVILFAGLAIWCYRTDAGLVMTFDAEGGQIARWGEPVRRFAWRDVNRVSVVHVTLRIEVVLRMADGSSQIEFALPDLVRASAFLAAIPPAVDVQVAEASAVLLDGRESLLVAIARQVHSPAQVDVRYELPEIDKKDRKRWSVVTILCTLFGFVLMASL